MLEFFDEVAMPALARAQADSDRGVLSADSRGHIQEAIATMVENLSEDEDATSAPERAAGPKPECMPGIVCVAGRNELDEAAALLLVHCCVWSITSKSDRPCLRTLCRLTRPICRCSRTPPWFVCP